MYKTTLLSALLLALAMQNVKGKPACGCAPPAPPPPPCQPTTPEPCVAKQEVTTTTSTTSNPCVTDAPSTAAPCIEQTTTSTTTTTEAPTTTTTMAPSTSTAAPKTDCSNGDIYPTSVGDCNQFLMCRNSVYVLMACPQGLGFNFESKECEWSKDVPTCNAA